MQVKSTVPLSTNISPNKSGPYLYQNFGGLINSEGKSKRNNKTSQFQPAPKDDINKALDGFQS